MHRESAVLAKEVKSLAEQDLPSASVRCLSPASGSGTVDS